MRIAIIGRSQLLYRTAELLAAKGYDIPLVITAKEAPEYSITAKDFEAFAQEHNATYIYTPKINLRDYATQILELGTIDIAVSINYTGVIPQDVIDLFPMGILNAHAGDLPKYRGNAPLAWAIINAETQAGLCIHQMIGGELDSGNILAKDYHPITINTRVGELFDWIESRIPGLMLQAVEQLSANPNFKGEPQSKNPKDALRGYPRLPEDGQIDWKQSAESILRLINASSEPFIGAFCSYEGEPMTIWRAELFHDDEVYSATAGQVAAINKDGSVIVITGNGKIRIVEIGFRGQRTMPGNIVKSIRKRLK